MVHYRSTTTHGSWVAFVERTVPDRDDAATATLRAGESRAAVTATTDGAAAFAAESATPIAPHEVTIVVLNWNRGQETLQCLESLRKAWFGGARPLVVDNGSRDGSVNAIREAFPDIRIVALPENRGYAGGNNAGIRAALEAGARAVLLLNNDARVAPDFLGWLLHVMNAVPRAAAVSGAILRSDHPDILEHAYLHVYFGYGLIRRHGVNALPGEGFDAVKPVEIGIGCCFLVRADALRRVGLLDEAYFAYHEDVDWCFRARKLGYDIYYQPLSRVWHLGSRSTLAKPRPQRPRPSSAGGLPNPIPPPWNPVRAYLGARNSVRFVRAHGTLAQKLYFVRSTLRELPLEFLAVVMDREDDQLVGEWTYRKALAAYCFPPDGGTSRRFTRVLRDLVRLPARLLWSLPRDVGLARRAGYTAQIDECARGLWDGVRNRPLPLERLGLR